MSTSKTLYEAASLTNLKSRQGWMFGSYQGHPVSVRQMPVMQGGDVTFRIRLRDEAIVGVARALRDHESIKRAGLKPRMVRLDASVLTYIHGFLTRAKPEAVKAKLDALVGIAALGGEALGDRCQVCGERSTGVVLVNGLPTQMCEADFRKLEGEFGTYKRSVAQARTAYSRGVVFGLAGMGLGSLIWAVILIASGYILSVAAIIIAGIIGYLVVRGAGKPVYSLIPIMAILTLGAVFVGELLWIAVFIVQLGGPFSFNLAWEGYLLLAEEDPGSVGLSFFFALIGVFFAGSYMFRATRGVKPRFEVIN